MGASRSVLILGNGAENQVKESSACHTPAHCSATIYILWPNLSPMLGQCHRRSASIKSSFGKHSFLTEILSQHWFDGVRCKVVCLPACNYQLNFMSTVLQ